MLYKNRILCSAIVALVILFTLSINDTQAFPAHGNIFDCDDMSHSTANQIQAKNNCFKELVIKLDGEFKGSGFEECNNMKGKKKSSALRKKKGACFREVALTLLNMEQEGQRPYRIIVQANGKLVKSYSEKQGTKHDNTIDDFLSFSEDITGKIRDALTINLITRIHKARENAGKLYNRCPRICQYIQTDNMSGGQEPAKICRDQVARKRLEDSWCYRSF
jgi:hypothetical protein